MLSLIFKGLQYLNCKAPDESNRYSSKLIILYELIEIDTQKLKGDNQMLPENRIIFDPNDVIDIFRVIFFEVVKYVKFDAGLMMKPLLVPDYLDGHELIGLVVEAFECLPEGSLAQKLLDFVPIAQVVIQDDLVIPSVVIVA
jgi:hypothetical protein